MKLPVVQPRQSTDEPLNPELRELVVSVMVAALVKQVRKDREQPSRDEGKDNAA